jgi:hypothetical protein
MTPNTLFGFDELMVPLTNGTVVIIPDHSCAKVVLGTGAE